MSNEPIDLDTIEKMATDDLLEERCTHWEDTVLRLIRELRETRQLLEGTRQVRDEYTEMYSCVDSPELPVACAVAGSTCRRHLMEMYKNVATTVLDITLKHMDLRDFTRRLCEAMRNGLEQGEVFKLLQEAYDRGYLDV